MTKLITVPKFADLTGLPYRLCLHLVGTGEIHRFLSDAGTASTCAGSISGSPAAAIVQMDNAAAEPKVATEC